MCMCVAPAPAALEQKATAAGSAGISARLERLCATMTAICLDIVTAQQITVADPAHRGSDSHIGALLASQVVPEACLVVCIIPKPPQHLRLSTLAALAESQRH